MGGYDNCAAFHQKNRAVEATQRMGGYYNLLRVPLGKSVVEATRQTGGYDNRKHKFGGDLGC